MRGVNFATLYQQQCQIKPTCLELIKWGHFISWGSTATHMCNVYVSMWGCVYIDIYICIYLYIFIYISIYISIYIYIYGRFHSGCTGHLQTFCNLMATKKFTGIIQTAILKLWTTIQIENIICKFIFKYLTCILALNFVPYIIFLKLVLGKSDSSSKSCENIIYMENW